MSIIFLHIIRVGLAFGIRALRSEVGQKVVLHAFKVGIREGTRLLSKHISTRQSVIRG